MTELHLHNTLSRKKQLFSPINPEQIGVYACGPTVYDKIHVGNARPLVVFDVLVRLLRRLYGAQNVCYVRNITDVDDKINQRASERNISIADLCAETIDTFHQDADALGVLPPDIEPRATHHIDEMIEMISTLIDKGFAYAAEGNVLFAVEKMASYGGLSGRSVDEMIAGARVEIAPFKQHPADFVLWKPSDETTPGWQSPWGYGRPGWHIECSAMSGKYLGAQFDIHAGGLDLIFPHHENEIAQSCCAHNLDRMANIWVHNGYVTVEGEKRSKSLGNFTTVADALALHRGETIRYCLLATHYRAPLDFSQNQLAEAKANLDKFYRATGIADKTMPADIDISELLAPLCDDLNLPGCFAALHKLAAQANKGDVMAANKIVSFGDILGLFQDSGWFTQADDDSISAESIEALIRQRNQARADKDFATADNIRDQLAAQNIRLLDSAEGTNWERG